MFNTSYIENVSLADRKTGIHKNQKSIELYSFNGKSSRYLVEVEAWEMDVYVLKFYSKKHKNSKHKFSLLSDDFDAQGVIGTVIRIAVKILEKNRNASFGFIGSPRKEENQGNTQRFRVYRQIMKNFFGYDTWEHFESEKSSSYLMLNNCHENPQDKAVDIVTMFSEIYDEFSDTL
ncbi:MAG: hypothetical protein AAF551_15765 [Bacteroidota bacterium]